MGSKSCQNGVIDIWEVNYTIRGKKTRNLVSLDLDNRVLEWAYITVVLAGNVTESGFSWAAKGFRVIIQMAFIDNLFTINLIINLAETWSRLGAA